MFGYLEGMRNQHGRIYSLPKEGLELCNQNQCPIMVCEHQLEPREMKSAHTVSEETKGSDWIGLMASDIIF